jgi:hypothetical protein
LVLQDDASEDRAGDRAPQPLLLFLLVLLFLAPLVHDRVFRSGNDASRFAQIESLVDRGQTTIDGSRYSTSDRVTIAGRSYSNKPPLLAVVGAALYALMRAAGLGFATHERIVVYLLTLLLAAVPTAWLVSRFATVLARAYPDRPWVRRLTVLALVTGTILTSFSVTVNGHTVAAALLFAGWVAALEKRPLLAGAGVALAAAVDIVPGVVFVPVIAYQVWESSGRRGLARLGAAVAACGVLAAGLNLWIVGTPLPPLFAAGAVDQSGEKNTTGLLANIPVGSALADPFASLGAALFGSHGFLSVSPILIAGVVGLAMAARRGTGGGPAFLPQRGTDTPQRGMDVPQRGIDLPQRGIAVSRAGVVAVTLGAVVLTLGHALFVLSLGGWSYGYRYLIPLIPFLLFFVPAAVGERWRWALGALVAVSIPLALLGAYHPWPPVFEPESPGRGFDRVTSPVGANLSAWLFRRAPDAAVTATVMNRCIGSNEREHNRYLFLFENTRARDDLARVPYLRSLERNPRSAVTHYDYAEALSALGDLDEAAKHYGYALELVPGAEEPRRGLADTLAAIERRRGSAPRPASPAVERGPE